MPSFSPNIAPLRASAPELQPEYAPIFLTVDVEEYYHAEALSGIVDRADRKKYPPHVEKNTMDLIRLFNDYNVHGTFFLLGTVAKRHNGLVRTILESGHEVASHGNDHRMITKMSPSEFREDVRRSKQIIEDITGTAVLGYRAPTFSIVERTAWAYEILLSEGFQYSSSVFPIHHDRYGWPEFGVFPRKMAVGGNRWIWEIPLSVGRVGCVNVPFGGGGYLRLYPLSLTKYFFRRLLRTGRPPIAYIHPWEIDLQHPRIAMPVLKRMRHYAGIPEMEEKMRDLFRSFTFERMAQFLQSTCTESRRDTLHPQDVGECVGKQGNNLHK